MSERASLRQLSDVQSVVCDAIHEMVVREDAEGGFRRLEEAATNLGGREGAVRTETSDRDGVTAALRAIKHLGRAMEAMAADAPERGEIEVESASDALKTATMLLRQAYGMGGESSSGPVQMSVTEALRVPNEEAITEALRNLLDRTGPQAFVIFLDARTGNFVQFIGSKEEPLVLDLPFTSLTDEEMERAADYFEAQGIEDARREESFAFAIGRDVQRATRLTAGVFHSIYQSEPDFSLKIEEN